MVLIVLANQLLQAQTKVLLITGGHDFAQEQFFSMFDSFEQYTYDWVEQPKANELICSSKIDDYDALVFYDMINEITEVSEPPMSCTSPVPTKFLTPSTSVMTLETNAPDLLLSKNRIGKVSNFFCTFALNKEIKCWASTESNLVKEKELTA